MKQLTPGKKRLLAYVGIVGSCAVLALVFFVSSNYVKARYDVFNSQYNGAVSQINAANNRLKEIEADETMDPVDKLVEERLQKDKITWYSGIKDDFAKKVKKSKGSFIALSVPAYTFSLLSLVSFGLCLKYEDKAKEKEEKDN